MFKLKSTKANYGINFPTSIEEITPKVLEQLTKDVSLAKHYVIVALCFKTKLFDLAAAINSNKETNIQVTPVIAKVNSDENTLSVGDKAIVDRSSLERGMHLNLKTVINSVNVRNYLKNDPALATRIMTNTGNIITANNQEDTKLSNQIVYILEFKIVPVNSIIATIPIKENNNDVFLVKEANVN